jgi:phosphocarrier protein
MSRRAAGAVCRTVPCRPHSDCTPGGRRSSLAAIFTVEVSVCRHGTSVSGSSIMGLMMLAAGPGTDLTISGRGDGADAAVEALARLVAAGFDED